MSINQRQSAYLTAGHDVTGPQRPGGTTAAGGFMPLRDSSCSNISAISINEKEDNIMHFNSAARVEMQQFKHTNFAAANEY